MHACLKVGDSMLMASDFAPGEAQTPQGFAVSIHIEDPEEADRVFAALSEGADVRMPIQETFWALRFGMLTDRFGTPWMINCQKTDCLAEA
jgi:PhnB protein